MTAERRVKCLRITAFDATVIKLAMYPIDLVMSNSEVYLAPEYAKLSDLNIVIEGAAPVLDFDSVYDGTNFTRSELQSGKWDGATVHYFATDWSEPVEDDEPIGLFTLGNIKEEDDRFTAELVGEQDKLNHLIGRTITATCGKVFANTHLDGETIIANAHYFCKVDDVANTVTGTITSVDSATDFYDSARTEVDDWFGNGEIIFTSGSNTGLSRRTVSEFTNATGKIVVNYPFYFEPEIGDSYQMIAGCRKRYTEDCITKHNNGVDFGGFPHVPTISQSSKVGSN